MSISTVTTDDLRRMNGKEGLVLQGCGGDPQEWLDGINELLTDEGILKDGSKFENISVFQNGSLTNILFPFEDGVEIDMGKLAMWRLHSHEQFGGTWLSDYVPNRLGGFITEHEPDKIKPDCRLIGEDGNSSTLWGLPPVHSAITDLRNRQRKWPAAFMSAAAMTKLSALSENMSI